MSSARVPLRATVYASEGRTLHAFALDAATGALVLVADLELPELVQYGAFAASGRFLYLSISDRAARHFVAAVALDGATGAPRLCGAPMATEAGRVIHLSIDRAAEHLVLAHPETPHLMVLELRGDGTLGTWRSGPPHAMTGFFTHQAQLDPESGGLVACALGADAVGDRAEQRGELTAFFYRDGTLTPSDRVVLPSGSGARHLVYGHGLAYVVLERGNCLAAYPYASGRLSTEPRFVTSTLRDPSNVRPAQRAGAIHFHPNRRYLYVTNRANAVTSVDVDGARTSVFAGGENAIALFDVKPSTGEPHLVGHFDTLGIEPRTFAIDPSGGYLVVANHSTLDKIDAAGRLRPIPRSYVAYRIEADGSLELRHKLDRREGDLFWVGSTGSADS
jgi:6-phosphogluconolactonase (cycloisomerase 2 family)